MISISDTVLSSVLNGAMISNRAKLNEKQIEVASGKRYQVRSEEAADASAAARVSANNRQIEQWSSNINPALNWTRMSEDSANTVIDVIQRLQELAVQSSDFLNQPDDLQLIAEEVDALVEQLAQEGNTKFGESYLLGGINTSIAPLTITRDANGTITDVSATAALSYDRRQVQVSETSVMEYGISVAGDKGLFFNSASGLDIFDEVIAFRDQLVSGNIPTDTMLEGLENCLDNVVNRMVENGVGQGRLEELETRYDTMQLAGEQALAELEDVDLAQSMIELSTLEASLTASYQMAAKARQMTILNYI